MPKSSAVMSRAFMRSAAESADVRSRVEKSIEVAFTVVEVGNRDQFSTCSKNICDSDL